MEIGELNTQGFCKPYLENVVLRKGDGSVFPYLFGELVGCENYDCIYKNHDGQRFLHEGEEPEFGFCNTFGLKIDIEKSRLIGGLIARVVNSKKKVFI